MTAPAGGAGGAAREALGCDRVHGPLWVVDGSVPGERVAVPGGPAGDLAGTGRTVGAARWLSHQLFRGVGAWAADEPCPTAAVTFAVLGRQFGAHADLLADRLPVVAVADPDVLTGAPRRWAALPEVLHVHGTERRLVTLGRVVLPRLVVAHARWLSGVAAAEASLRRALRLVLADEQHAWVTVEALVLDHVVDERAAAGHQAAAAEALPGDPLGDLG